LSTPASPRRASASAGEPSTQPDAAISVSTRRSLSARESGASCSASKSSAPSHIKQGAACAVSAILRRSWVTRWQRAASRTSARSTSPSSGTTSIRRSGGPAMALQSAWTRPARSRAPALSQSCIVGASSTTTTRPGVRPRRARSAEVVTNAAFSGTRPVGESSSAGMTPSLAAPSQRSVSPSPSRESALTSASINATQKARKSDCVTVTEGKPPFKK
jgi:hypothetical protein